MNNVIVLFRSLSASALGCYGSVNKTPAFDDIAARGDLFTHCYADLMGKSLDKFLKLFPTQEINEPATTIDLFQMELLQGQEHQAFVLDVVQDQEGEASDEILAMILEQLSKNESSNLNLIVTTLTGLRSDLDSDSVIPHEKAVHVPLIISSAGQKTCRRRTELLTTQNVVKIIECLCRSKEDYQTYRDSLVEKQITYHSEHVTATRTQHWLLFTHQERNEHDEKTQQLFRKPEDVWEILDVADQYPQVIEHFEATGQLTFPDAV